MTIEWGRLRRLMTEDDAPAIAAALRDLTDAERKALATPLKEFERRERQVGNHLVRSPGVLTLAGAGILANASELAPWFRRWGVNTGFGAGYTFADLVLEVLRARQVTWAGVLAHKLAELRGRGSAHLQVVLGLAVSAGLDPPATDQLVQTWAQVNRGIGPGALDPAWDGLLLRVFDVDGVGRRLEFGDGRGLGLSCVALVADGRLDRPQVIDLCLGALQRGGSLGDVRGYLAVYTALNLELPEVIARLRDYPPLLADGHSTAAAMAQRELFQADDAGALPIEMLLGASRSVFARTEKKLVRAHLDRLRTALTRAPERTDDLLRVLATVFGHPALDLQQRALDIAIAFTPAGSAETRRELAAAATALPADLRTRAAEALGSADAAEPAADLVGSAPTLPGPATRDAISPTGSPEELAEELAVLWPRSSGGEAGRCDPVALERVLDGLVRWSYRDRAALRAALGAEHAEINWDRWLSHSLCEDSELTFAIHVATIPAVAKPNARYPDLATFAGDRGWQQKLSQAYGQRPYTPAEQPGMLLARLHEITVGVVHAPRPFLLATPTISTGLLDPDVLLARLATAAAEGWQPWPRDLLQALLRLPADSDASLATRAHALGTAAGDRLAQWLATDPDERVETCVPQVVGARGEFTNLVYNSFLSCWSAMLPGHRDVVARHLVPVFQDLTEGGRGGGPLLLTLAGADGPVRDATLDAFAYGLNAKDQNDRAGAVDALLVLAGRGELDGALFGRRIGELTTDGQLVLGRTVPGLRDLARSGAATHSWQAVAAALPALLTAQRPPSGLADLLALGVELADELRLSAEIPHLADVAARRGSSRVITEAKRLAVSLT